jgi:hypothetical protein
MRVKKRIPLGVLTVSATPHTKNGSTYRALLSAAFDLGRPIRVRGDEFAFLASCVDLDPNLEHSDLSGEIHKYTDITDEDWENIKNRKAATIEDLKTISIPDYLKPNREAFRYFFFVKEHRLVIQLKGKKRSISHEGLRLLFDGLFSAKLIKDKFPLVSVTIEQEPDSLERIFKLHRLDHLVIELQRPNSDSVSENEERFVERLLAQQNARSLKVELHHAPGESLAPDAQNKKLAKAAVSYGKVYAKGTGPDFRPVEIDTSNHPIKEPFDYDKTTRISFVDQMRAAARALVGRIMNRKHQDGESDETR